jgi:hypothetical protein
LWWGKLKERGQKGRPRRRRGDNIKTDGGQRCAQGPGRKPEGKGPVVRPRSRWEDNIKMDGGLRCAQYSGRVT